MSFKSTAVNLKDISEQIVSQGEVASTKCFFSIPIYQRLYVWGNDQVSTLLEDLWGAYKSKKEIFYLGGVLVVEQPSQAEDKGYRHFDLIDGQQRFTTLWLMSSIFGGELSKFQKESFEKDTLHRIKFAIRPDISTYFEQLVDQKNDIKVPVEAKQIEDALAVMNSFKDALLKEGNSESTLLKFSEFIYEKVQLIFTIVPDNTDLNKLFEVINNRGVQLQHHEILKAKLLGKLGTTEEKAQYGILWDACSNMNEFIEKNLKNSTDIKIADLFNSKDSMTDDEELASSTKVLQMLASKQNDDTLTSKSLTDILNSSETFSPDNSQKEIEEEAESDVVRSIISFPLLLQHTLRIWLHNNDEKDVPKILEKELLSLFS